MEQGNPAPLVALHPQSGLAFSQHSPGALILGCWLLVCGVTAAGLGMVFFGYDSMGIQNVLIGLPTFIAGLILARVVLLLKRKGVTGMYSVAVNAESEMQTRSPIAGL